MAPNVRVCCSTVFAPLGAGSLSEFHTADGATATSSLFIFEQPTSGVSRSLLTSKNHPVLL